MPQKRYKVVFSGKFVEGKNPGKALEMIASMFKVAPEKVRAAFAKGPGAVIVSTDDRDQAQRYVNGMKKAGAICMISTQHGERLSSSKMPGSVEKTVKAAGSPSGAQVVEIATGPTDITLTTLACPRLSGAHDSLNLGRKDRASAGFGDIALASVYNTEDGTENYRMLFFLRGNKRPFGAECTSIAFGDFPGVKGPNLLSSLRNFLTFLYARNPGIIFDRATYDFIAGSRVPLFAKDEIMLATALYRAMPYEPYEPDEPNGPDEPDEPKELRAAGAGAGYGAAPAPEEPLKDEDPSAKGVCPKCGAPREKGKPDCPRCGLVFINWYRDKGRRRGALAASEQAGPAPDRPALYAFLAGMALLTGFLLPMPKTSLAFGMGQVIIWPWHLVGIGIKAPHAAAMATPYSDGAPVVWSLVLVLSAVAAFALGRIPKPAVRTWGWLLAGSLTLALVLIVFQSEGFILGSIFWPPSMGAGLVWMLGLLAAGVLASINHVRKLHDVSGRLRLLQGISGGLLLIIAAFMLVAGPGAWGTWPIVIAELLVISYAALGIYCAWRSEPSLEGFLSLLARISLAALPVAGTIAQAYVSQDPSDIIIAPGGAWSAAFGHMKAALILGGAATVFCAGFLGLLQQKYSSP